MNVDNIMMNEAILKSVLIVCITVELSRRVSGRLQRVVRQSIHDILICPNATRTERFYEVVHQDNQYETRNFANCHFCKI